MHRILDKYKSLFVTAALAITVLVVFGRVYRFEFVDYDDDAYVSNNAHISSGLTVANIVWVFTSEHGGNWHPVTGLSHLLDCQLFGLNSGMHHVVNLLFHLANAVLLFTCLRKMTGAFWQSAFVAAAFAIHPLHVESVAWISERKDVLSTLFWILTMMAYCRYVKNPAAAPYLLTLALFALGLMSKPMLVTLPFVLLLLDYWPLNRFKFLDSSNCGTDGSTGKISQWTILGRLVWEKVPFLVLSAVSCAVTIIVQSKIGALKNSEQYSSAVRVSNAVVSYVGYIVKMTWPANLAVFYPHPENALAYRQIFDAVILLVLITVAVIRISGKYRYLLTGWFWYLGTLVPVIGLVQVGDQSMADRYMYIPLVGLFIVISWGANDLLTGWKYKEPVLRLSSVVVIVAIGAVTWFQVSYWHDSVSLFSHAIEVTMGNYVAYNNRGVVYKNKGQYDLAISDYNKALQIDPNYAETYNNRGNAYKHKGRYDLAISDFNKAIELNPNYADAYYNRGNVYYSKGELDHAVSDYNKVIKLNPGCAEAYNNRANVYGNKGQFDSAISDYNKAIEINPRLIEAFCNRGNAYKNKGSYDMAISDFNKAIELSPTDAAIYNNRGDCYYGESEYNLAISDYIKVLEINPKLVEIYLKKAVSCEQAGRKKEAVEAYKSFIQYAPAQYAPQIEFAKQKISRLEQ